MDWITKLLKELVASKYTGKIEINFYQGGISNINKFESIKAPTQELSKEEIHHMRKGLDLKPVK